MALKIEEHGSVKVVKLEGKMDVGLSISVEGELEKMIDAGASFMVFNLAGVEYLSSSGLRVFISIMRKLKDKKGKLVLCAVPEIVKKIFKTVELEDLFEVYETAQEAISACK